MYLASSRINRNQFESSILHTREQRLQLQVLTNGTIEDYSDSEISEEYM